MDFITIKTIVNTTIAGPTTTVSPTTTAAETTIAAAIATEAPTTTGNNQAKVKNR